MKYVVIVCFLILSSNHTYSQYLAEQEWALFSSHIAKGDHTGFEKLLAQKDFIKSEETNEKYRFYTWKQTDDVYYGVRVNKKSGQVTYMTNDQNYVLKLLSKFIREYALVKSEKQGERSITHIFDTPKATIAVKLDTTGNFGTHLLFAIKKS